MIIFNIRIPINKQNSSQKCQLREDFKVPFCFIKIQIIRMIGQNSYTSPAQFLSQTVNTNDVQKESRILIFYMIKPTTNKISSSKWTQFSNQSLNSSFKKIANPETSSSNSSVSHLAQAQMKLNEKIKESYQGSKKQVLSILNISTQQSNRHKASIGSGQASSQIKYDKHSQVLKNIPQFFNKKSERLQTVETVQSNNFIEQNKSKQHQYQFRCSQPLSHVMSTRTIQVHQKTARKQKINIKNNKFNNGLSSESPNQLFSCLSQNKLDACINNSKIKLRDYLFMMNTSKTLAESKKRDSDRTSRSFAEYHRSDSSLIHPGNKMMINSSSSKNRVQKYRITNAQMCEVLKTQIKNDMQRLQSKLNAIDSWLDSSDSLGNDQIANLCGLRREFQRYNQELQFFCNNKVRINLLAGKDSIVDTIHQDDQKVQIIDI